MIVAVADSAAGSMFPMDKLVRRKVKLSGSSIKSSSVTLTLIRAVVAPKGKTTVCSSESKSANYYNYVNEGTDRVVRG